MDTIVAHDLWADLGLWESRQQRFAECILHIGTEKTGSTSLQNFLGLNREALAKIGFFVPASLSPYDVTANHERLTTFALSDDKLVDDLRVAAHITVPQDLPKHRADISRGLRDEIAGLPKGRAIGGQTLLLSNEHCHSRLVDKSEVARLRDFILGFAKSVRVVVYLRPQHELAISSYDQALKSGFADISILPDFTGRTTHWVPRSYFDYADLLDRWAAVFGKEAIKVRMFDKAELVNGSVIDDFSRLLGLTGLGELKVPKNSNVSMGANRQTSMNAINRLSRVRAQALTPELRASLIDQFQQTTRNPGLRPCRKDAQAFYHSFALSNERVRAAFLPERDCLFHPDFDTFPTVAAPLNEADALAATVIAQQQTINQLKQLLARRQPHQP